MPGKNIILVFILFFLSGFTALVYQVLWMKELGLLFGNTAQATATTLATFFLGLMIGSYYFGAFVNKSRNALISYAFLELSIAVSALLYFLLLYIYYAIYSYVFGFLGHNSNLFLLIKFLMSIVILFPPAFFMGGTFPVISHYLISRSDMQGRIASALYGTNILGAMLGALLAGFYLPVLLGFDGSYYFAVILTLIISTSAYYLARTGHATNTREILSVNEQFKENYHTAISFDSIRVIAFFSGFTTIGLEVIWTRMFSQVLQNSVYTFSMILVIFLFALSSGAWLAHLLVRYTRIHPVTLFILIVFSAVLVVSTPFLFMFVTNNLNYIGGDSAWFKYIINIFTNGIIVLLVPGIFIGTLFPFTLKLVEPYSQSIGKSVGLLTAINTGGAILGSLFAGFISFQFFGLWYSIGIMSAIYVLLLVYLVLTITPFKKIYFRLITVLLCAGLYYVFNNLGRLPVVYIDEKYETLVDVWEDSSGTTAVINRAGTLKLKVNNYYTLGGAPSSGFEERQSQIPLLLHPNPDNVFFLGMGTGITAGTALQYPVEKITVSELLPDAINAARKYFRDYLYGLFEDKRVTIIAEDGRNYLQGTDHKFDLIISDLFIPWKAGSGNLYTKEHYQTVLARLKKQGLFVQWVPMYQVSAKEFGIIAKTMLDVFPMVTLWRGGFMRDKAIMGIIGHKNDLPIQHVSLKKNLQYEISKFNYSNIIYPLEANGTGFNQFRENPDLIATFMLYYAGNLSHAAKLFDQYPVNTDNWQLIEYLSPKTHRAEKALQNNWFVNDDLIALLKQVLEASPPGEDLYLENLSHSQKHHVNAGLYLHEFEVSKISGKRNYIERTLENFRNISMPEF